MDVVSVSLSTSQIGGESFIVSSQPGDNCKFSFSFSSYVNSDPEHLIVTSETALDPMVFKLWPRIKISENKCLVKIIC